MTRNWMPRFILPLLTVLSPLSAFAHHDCAPANPTTIEELAKGHRAILVGELHGTVEMPAAVARIVDEASLHDRSVVVALEHRAADQDQIDQIFASDDTKQVEQRFETFSTKDGRSSEAMKSLVVELWSMTQMGRKIEVVGVDYWWGEAPSDDGLIPEWISKDVDPVASLRDVRMGQNAIAACEAHDCDLLLLFAGNFHTNTEVSLGGMWNAETETFERMPVAPAGHVIAQQYDTVSIYLAHRGGEFTANIGSGMQSNSTGPNAGKFVQKDHVPYCSFGPSRSHQYVMSVGSISSSSDLSE